MNHDSQLLIYQTPDGQIKIDVHLENETVWLTQAHIAELFDKSRSTITEHINNVFKEGELDEAMVCRNFRHTTQHGALEYSKYKEKEKKCAHEKNLTELEVDINKIKSSASITN